MVEVANSLMQWTSLEWVVEQTNGGNAVYLGTWTLLVFAVGFIVGGTCEHYRQGRIPKRKIARGFSGSVKAAARAALESDDMVPVGQFEQSIAAFSGERPGVFVLSDPPERIGSASTYQLAPEWRVYLKKHMRFLE